MEFVQSKNFQDGGLKCVLLVRHGEQFKKAREFLGCASILPESLEYWAVGTWIIYQ